MLKIQSNTEAVSAVTIFQIFDYKMYGSGQSRKAQPLADETKYQF